MTRLICYCAIALSLAASPAMAEQRQVYGKVLAVQPLEQDSTPVEECSAAQKPSTHEGLSALLHWDLVARPSSEQACVAAAEGRIQGYRVTYEWNGHRFEDVLPRDPGKYIPLTVQID